MPPNKYPLPKKGDLIPPETLTLEHPEFTARKDDYAFWRHSDELTGGYKASVATYTGPEDVPTFKETYLIPHVKEASYADFARRVAAAKPPRFVKEGIESLTGVVTQQQPNRDNYPPKLSKWTNGVTIDGATLQQWISSKMWPLIERYGHCYSYARRPSIGGANLKEQEKAIKDSGQPEVLLHIITPEALPWWDTDELGAYTVARYIEEIDRPELKNGYPVRSNKIKRHWWITHEGWWYTEELSEGTIETTLKVLDVGTWGKPLKHFPIVKWALKDEMPPTATASLAQLMYFRKDSELHIVEVGAAFPMVWVPTAAGDENPAETVKGVDSVGAWDAENLGGARPMILETTGVALTHFIEKRLPQLEEEALAPYGRQREIGGNDSGVALAHIQQSAVNIYRQHSRAGAMSEFAALQPVAELLGETLDDGMRAAWSDKFGTLSDASQSEILTAFAALEPGDLFMESILSEYAGLTTEMTPEQLKLAIEDWRKAKEEQLQREQEQEDFMAEGEDEMRRANVDKIGAETEVLKKGPFAMNPKSAKGPNKGQKP